ncbi:MAG TPA: agmatinase [Candidatus Baltobacteraceae bacterium]|nr:agmatinase [Candidatus Baltobacteraceae bacterium]
MKADPRTSTSLEGAVALAGFPSDANSSYKRGPAKAPPAIRAAMWSEAGNPYTESGIKLRLNANVVDAGDAPLREDDDDRATIEAFAFEQLARGHRILSLGGDHSVTYPIVRAVARRYPKVNIVHFDAHPDLYPSFGGNRFSHACPFARILEDAGIGSLVQIGIRTMTPPQREVADRYGVRVFGPDELDEARRSLPSGDVYVTLDLDGIDPAFAPGVSHREPGGLSVRDVLKLVAAIPGNVVGADVVELNPDCDVDGLTATVAAKFAREFVGRMLADANTPAARTR